MAIIIAASQIYDILDNEKVIDNNVGGIDTSEDELQKTYGTVSNTIEINLFEWNKDGDFSSTDIDDFVTYIGNEQNNETYNITLHEDTATYSKEYSITGNFRFNIEKNVKPGKIYLMIDRDSQSFNNGSPTDHGDVEKTEYNTQTSTIQEIDYNGESQINFNFTSNSPSWYRTVALSTVVSGWVSGWFRNYIRLYLVAEHYESESTDISYGENPKFSIENNELLQADTTINNKKLSQYNYEQITAEWGEGKELATIKCSIGEYYEYDESADDHKGALAISTQNNDLPMIFNIGDLVIPYIAVANGQTEPLSIKLDGTPKVFKVTQIRPYFDGAFWQELVLQEHTKQ